MTNVFVVMIVSTATLPLPARAHSVTNRLVVGAGSNDAAG
jgi:hypothetical protein